MAQDQLAGRLAFQTTHALIRADSQDGAEGNLVSNDRSQDPNFGGSPGKAETFLMRLHRMLAESTKLKFDHVVGWLQAGCAFKIFKPEVFYTNVMPQYFDALTNAQFLRR